MKNKTWNINKTFIHFIQDLSSDYSMPCVVMSWFCFYFVIHQCKSHKPTQKLDFGMQASTLLYVEHTFHTIGRQAMDCTIFVCRLAHIAAIISKGIFIKIILHIPLSTVCVWYTSWYRHFIWIGTVVHVYISLTWGMQPVHVNIKSNK